MAVNFSGYVFQDDGDPVSGAAVSLLHTGTTSEEDDTTTNSDGLWAFSEGDQDRYDVKIESSAGGSVRYIRWADQISLKEIDVRNNTNAATPAATFTNLTDNASNQVAVFSGANATRAAGDEIYISFKLADSAGNLDEFARITAEAVDVTSDQEDGQLRFGVASTDGTMTDVFTINSTTGGETSMTLDVSGDLVLDADGGDIFFKDGGTTFGSATNTSGNLIIKSGTTTALTFSGANVTGAGTYTGGGLMTTGGSIVIPDAGNIGSASDTDAIAISSGGVVTMNQIPVFSAGINVSGGTIAGTIATATQNSITTMTGLVTTGALASGTIASGFGTISTGNTITTTAKITGGELDIDDVIINGATIGHTDDTDLITLADGIATVAGEISVTTLDIGGTNVSATAAEINLIDGDTARGTTAIADGDGVLINDGGTMRMTTVQTLAAYLDDEITAMPNLVTTGTIGTGVWQGTAIASSYIADDAIDSDHYTDGSIDTAHIADNQVTLAKMAGLARGKIIYGDASGDPAALAVGSADYVLTSDGTDVAWAAVSSAAVTAVANGADNRVATFSSSTALNGEANLTFDGTTLTANALVVDDVAIDAKVITMTGSSSDTAVFTAGTNGTLSIVTTDAAAAAANIQITADGTAELAGTTVTLDSAGDIELEATSGNDINIPSDVGLTFGDDAEKIEGDGTDLTISGNNIKLTATADVVIPADVGITFGSGEKIEGDSTDLTITSGAKINLSATSDIHIPNDVGIIFGGDSEKIEGDGTDLTISANNLTVDAAADITLDAGGADLIFADDGTNLLKITNSSSDVVFQPQVNAKDIKFNQYDGNLLLDINDGGWVGVHNAAAGPGELRIYEDTDLGSHYTGFKAGNATASVSYVLPLADGSADQVLSTDGSGTLAWASAGSGATQIQAYVYAMSV